MEVFITEKEEVSENFIGKHFEYGQLSNYIASSQLSTVALIFNTDWKSLEKHDAEVRAKERNKWQDKFNELEKWANKKMYWTDDIQGTYTGNGYALCQEKLKQKLNELKEIK